MIDKEYELWSKYGATQMEKGRILLGPHSSYEWKHSRRQLLFTAARYKFAMKMIGNIYEPGRKDILDLGCSDGFGTYYVAEDAKSVVGVDFDEGAIEFAKSFNESDIISFQKDNFLGKIYGRFDGVVSFDVIEHIYPENVDAYMKTVVANLKSGGVFVVGTPSLENQLYSRENVKKAHINCYKGEALYAMLKGYFNRIIHTGHLRMANYLIAVCSNPKANSPDLASSALGS